MKKRDARKLDPAAQHELRKQVIASFKRGLNRVQISETVGLSYPSVCNIVNRYRASKNDDLSSLAPVKRGRRKGEARRLTTEQEAMIHRTICEKRPEELKMEFGWWNQAAVLQLIERKCSCKISLRTVENYLKRWGFVPNKTIKRACEHPQKSLDKELVAEVPVRKKAEHKKPGPKSGEPERKAWSLTIAMITKAANAEGLNQCDLERYFGVGDKGGRVWRSWLDAQKLAREETREKIYSIAQKNGWITSQTLMIDFNLPMDDPKDLHSELKQSPRHLAQALIDGARGERSDKREEMLELLRCKPQESEYQNSAQAKRIVLNKKSNQITKTKARAWLLNISEEDRIKAIKWDEAVNNVRNLLIKVEVEENLELEAADRHVFIQLIDAYHSKSEAGFAS